MTANWTQWTVCVPTDLGPRSEIAYAHAMKLAMGMGHRLIVVHAHREAGVEWRQLPSVRDMMVRWGVLPQEATVDDYGQLGLQVQFDEVVASDWLDALAQNIDASHPEILVLTTEGRTGSARWLESSVAEALARKAHRTALFIGPEARPFVDADTGEVALHRVLLPMNADRVQQQAVDWAAGVVEALWDGPTEFVIVHAGGGAPLPPLTLPDRPGWVFRSEFVKGAVVGAIVDQARMGDADLIVMTTHGHDSLGDWLQGSHTERVVRQAPCPVLAIPV